MAARSWRYALACVTACFLLALSEARAGVVLITRGETICHLGDACPPAPPPAVPPAPPDRRDREANTPAPNRGVGYKYGYWGIFWIDLWTWGGEYCVYEGDRYRPISRGEAARLMGKPETELGTPLLYRVPLGWFIFAPLIVLLSSLIVLMAVKDLANRARFGPRMTLDEIRQERDPARMVQLLRYHLGWSPGKIAEELNRWGVRNRGLPWRMSDVERLIQGL